MCLAVCVAACGRSGFEPVITDATSNADGMPLDAADTLLAECMLHLTVEEPVWTGAAAEVSTRCASVPGTAVDGARVVEDDIRGRVAELVGGTSCIEFGSPPSLEPVDQLTISAWIFPTHSDLGPHGIVSKRIAFEVASQFALFLDNGDEAWVDINDASERFNTPSPITIDAWQQVTVVFDGRKAALVRVAVYLDGDLDVVAPDNDPVVDSLDSPFVIGCLPDGAMVQSFVGRLDDVILWRRALSEAEVMAWYTRTKR